MSDDYKIQLSSTINGNLLNLRANSGAELRDLVSGLAEELDDVLKGFTDVKQGIVAKDIFTGNASAPKGGGQTSTAASSGGPTKENPGNCGHNKPWKDLTSKGYKSTHYCSEQDRDSQCKPLNLR